jgi:hypothetical protein
VRPAHQKFSRDKPAKNDAAIPAREETLAAQALVISENMRRKAEQDLVAGPVLSVL